MKQSRLMSLIEAIANVVVGYSIAVLTQLVVFPWFGLPAHFDDALAIGVIFTAVSIARSFALRRLFNAIHSRPGWTRNEPTRRPLQSSADCAHVRCLVTSAEARLPFRN